MVQFPPSAPNIGWKVAYLLTFRLPEPNFCQESCQELLIISV